MNAQQFVQLAKIIGLILFAIALLAAIMVRPAEPSTAQDACRLPVPNEKLIVTLNHADGKAICTYHRVIGWGMAR